MPRLHNLKHEAFAQAVAADMGLADAYEHAGFVRRRGNPCGNRDAASRLANDLRRIARALDQQAGMIEVMPLKIAADERLTNAKHASLLPALAGADRTNDRLPDLASINL